MTGNPIVAPFFGAGLANMAWRITQDSTSTQQAIQAGAVAANTGVQASRVAVGGALGAGQLALGAAELATRNRQTYTDPAAAVAGGGGYSFALPDAPGASTRGMDGMNADQFRDLLRQAYMRGGMDMHERYQGRARMVNQDIRDMPAQGTGSLPRRPAALPLTNAPVGQTPASSSRDRAPTPPLMTPAGQAGAAAAARLQAPPMHAGGMSREDHLRSRMAAAR